MIEEKIVTTGAPRIVTTFRVRLLPDLGVQLLDAAPPIRELQFG
jgi:hypothetical protein